MIEHQDVLVIGAGLSGIAAGYYLQKEHPQKTYAILEGLDTIGGTWDLFRYPGIRSDSDMYTLGYTFNPWKADSPIGDGATILAYIKATARQFGIDQKIRFNHRVCDLSWASTAQQWTVSIQKGDDTIQQMTCNFLMMCTGYYDYDAGYTPQFSNREVFQGEIIHPQQWVDNITYQDKKVIVIGSGATAVTLVPALAEKAAHVTMLQRSPSYIFPRPSDDPLARWFYKNLPEKLAYKIIRWMAIGFGIYNYTLSRWIPDVVASRMIDMVREELGDDYDVETHFTPTYNPWDQRICMALDGDLFAAIREQKVTMVTDSIDHFTDNGLALQSGKAIEADLIVTATGLNVKFLKGITVRIDEQVIDLSQTTSYKGTMLSRIPNLAISFGYTNASWTLKSELICQYVCRLMAYMDKHQYQTALPKEPDSDIEQMPFVNFSSSYIKRAVSSIPKQGTDDPYKVYQNYVLDTMMLRFRKLDDGTMIFQ